MRKVFPLVGGSALGLLVMSAGSAPISVSAQQVVPMAVETPVVGSCTAARTKYIATNSTELQTSSMNYVAAPQASVEFQQQADGCVIAYFSGVVFAPGARAVARRILLRAVLEGTDVIAIPSDVQLSGDDDENFNGRWARAHSMIFVFPSVNAGHYRVAVQWRTPDGNTVHLHQHSLFVRHQ